MTNLSLLSLSITKPKVGDGYNSRIVLIDKQGYRMELTKKGFHSRAAARAEAMEKITSQYGINPKTLNK